MAVSEEVIELSRLLDSRFATEEVSLDDRGSQSHSATTSLYPADRTTIESVQNLELSDANDDNNHASSIAKGHDVSVRPLAEEEDSDYHRTHHAPWALRRLHLICLVVVSVLMIIALEVTQYISNKNQGLATTTQRIHYLWTYGPTAGNFHAPISTLLRLTTFSILRPRDLLGRSGIPNKGYDALEADVR